MAAQKRSASPALSNARADALNVNLRPRAQRAYRTIVPCHVRRALRTRAHAMSRRWPASQTSRPGGQMATYRGSPPRCQRVQHVNACGHLAASEGTRDRFVRLFVERAQQYRRGLGASQAADGPQHLVLHDRFPCGGLRNTRSRQVVERHIAPPPAKVRPQLVAGGVETHSEHERVGVWVAGNGGQFSPESGQCILERVLGEIGIAHDAPDRAQHAGLAAHHQPRKLHVPVGPDRLAHQVLPAADWSGYSIAPIFRHLAPCGKSRVTAGLQSTAGIAVPCTSSGVTIITAASSIRRTASSARPWSRRGRIDESSTWM